MYILESFSGEGRGVIGWTQFAHVEEVSLYSLLFFRIRFVSNLLLLPSILFFLSTLIFLAARIDLAYRIPLITAAFTFLLSSFSSIKSFVALTKGGLLASFIRQVPQRSLSSSCPPRE